MNILIMAGTKDARDIIELISSNRKNKESLTIYATTVTNYGAKIAKDAGADIVYSKPLSGEKLKEVLKREEIKLLIDATHPFAKFATINAIKACHEVEVNYVRFERPPLNFEGEKIHKVDDFEKAGILANELVDDGTIFHLAGVNTLKDVLKNVLAEQLFVRVLPNIISIQRCNDLGISGEKIVAMQGTFSKEFNKALLEEYNTKVIITKESGETGGVSEKVEAAQELDLDIVLVTRPKILELENEIVLNSVSKFERLTHLDDE